MGSFNFFALLLAFWFWASIISPSLSQTCKSMTFAKSKKYANCLDLPTLASYLHYTYDSANSTLSVAFTATPRSSAGWVAWAINPTAPQMDGAQALVAYKDSTDVMTVKTYNISGYSLASIVQSKLAFDVWDTSAEMVGEMMRFFAKIKVPAELAAKGTVNQVWQVGPSVFDGILTPHMRVSENLDAKGTLDLNAGVASTANGGVAASTAHGGVASTAVDSRIRRKNVILLFFLISVLYFNLFS